MWYSSPSTSPQDLVTSDDVVDSVQVDFRSAECVAVAEGPSEPDLAPNAIPSAPQVRAAVAASAVPGTEYWLP